MSRLILQKGVRESLLGFAHLASRRPDVAYLIAGEGNAEPMLRAMAQEMNISDKVYFLGPVSRADLPMVLSAADAFSLYLTAAGRSRNRAARGGCVRLPAILSSHLTLPELVARYVPPTDPDAVAEALAATLDGLGPRDQSLLPKRYSSSTRLPNIFNFSKKLSRGI